MSKQPAKFMVDRFQEDSLSGRRCLFRNKFQQDMATDLLSQKHSSFRQDSLRSLRIMQSLGKSFLQGNDSSC